MYPDLVHSLGCCDSAVIVCRMLLFVLCNCSRRQCGDQRGRVLADLERDCIRVVRMTDVEEVVSRFFGVPTDDLKSARRHRSVSRPRMLAMFLARKLTQAAYSEIGQYFGGRNHSTVMSAERNVKGWLEQGTPIDVASQSWPLEDVLEALEQQLMAG